MRVCQVWPSRHLRCVSDVSTLGAMLTRKELGEALKLANVDAVAKKANVAPKTIYRIRQNDDYSPTMRVAERLENALLAMMGRAQ